MNDFQHETRLPMIGPFLVACVGAVVLLATTATVVSVTRARADDEAPAEAPTGFTMVSNGLTDQDEFDANLAQFSEEAREGPGGDGDDRGEGGLGPTYNAASCLNCHNNPAPGGGSQVAELRVGHWDGTTFTAPPGGSLIRLRAVRPVIQPRIPDGFEVRTRRLSTGLFGLGYVEAISDVSILQVQANQSAEVRGTAVLVPVTVGQNPDGSPATSRRFGRFGWKCQHGSLIDFAADAQLNEKGITSPLQPTEAPAPDGRPLDQFDRAPDPEDAPADGAPFGKDVKAYTRFMRSLRAPPRDFVLQGTEDARQGERLFASVGCAACHVPTWVTAPAGSTPRGSQAIPDALGNRVIHPYSDYLLHDVGTGDGIVQGGPPETRTMVRTAPLWGLRARGELMHDGLSYTIPDAIDRHAGQAAGARANYRALTDSQKRQFRAFLLSL
jgi:CxxC motif-containing protein (DUF1111 family)